MRMHGVFFPLLLSTNLLAALPQGPAGEDTPSRFVRTGLFAEISGGGSGVVGDVKNQSGLFLGGRIGYVIGATVSFNVRVLSGKTKLNDPTLSPDTPFEPDIGTVALEGAVRLIQTSPIYPIFFLGYGYTTMLESPLPVFNGSGYHGGVGVVYHFADYFSVGANGYFSRTWYHVRNPPAGTANVTLTDDRLWAELTVAFWPGITP